MKKLQLLHEQFIDIARRPMTFGRLPVKPLVKDDAEVILIPVNRWVKLKSPTRLRKIYKFLSQESRNRFVSKLFEYENDTKHNGMITVEEDQVTLDLRTKDIDDITELDKEYAKFADVLYKDVVYNPTDV